MKTSFFKFLVLTLLIFSIFSCTQATVFAEEATTFTPIHEYNFDNDSGTTVLDTAVSGGINGTCSRNNIITENGQTYRSFNGKSDVIKFTSPIIPTGEKTICFSIKVPSLPSKGNVWIMHTLDGNSTRPNGTGILIPGSGDAYGRLMVVESSGRIISPISICDDKWHYIVYTYDGTTDENGMKLYIDGILMGEARNKRLSSTVDNNLEIGCHYSADEHFFLGDLDNIKVYDKDISCNAPTNLRATDDKLKICLAWDTVDNATSYVVKRSMTAGGLYTTLATVTSTSYVDNNVTNGNCYYYVVSAVNSVGESKNSNEASAIPQVAKPEAPTSLIANSRDSKVTLSWNNVEGATSYNVKRATTPDGDYTTIATTSAAIYIDNNVTNGITYYYVVSAINDGGESENSNEVSATPKNPAVTLEVTSVDKAKLGEEITANIVIHNADKICAEDLKIYFDTTKLQFISAEGADGIKIYKEADIEAGIKRFITASLGKENAANGDKVLLKLKFKTIAKGEAKIDILTGRIADNATLEEDVKEEYCGEKLIIIEPATIDVNRSGEYTLLDLGIDAWYYGDVASSTDTSKYDADQDGNGVIDDYDLCIIVMEILNNTNYPANS
ncbi:hypothetical protein EHE19_007135 [Ruminiclostridium herbifermentans]|uniref:Fibronectin type-III domain-containing protein n=1 Tax=Ruminiclostridium herbifermentans TaxID=2488810 RepID=A0A4U7JLR7_9FIRM|nr:LamG-like jellyroll fold domain-containing protein [Ruminiclostridium herbifermentans]QNU68188.1 hypothetical protein EHE19_007135 [Ruminiclostridium herbifermentans]